MFPDKRGIGCNTRETSNALSKNFTFLVKEKKKNKNYKFSIFFAKKFYYIMECVCEKLKKNEGKGSQKEHFWKRADGHI